MIDGIELAKQILKLSKENNGYEERLYCKNHVCNRIGCPMYDENGECNELMIKALVEYINIPKNFDHYVIKNGVGITMENDCEKWEFNFKKETEKEFLNADCNSVFEWLLKPYGEKGKYKLTKFAHDLLVSKENLIEHDDCLAADTSLIKLKEMGYFKDISLYLPIREILKNCEVKDDD